MTKVNPQLKNIIFDFGGVIVEIDKQRAIERFKEIGFVNISDYIDEYRQVGPFLELEEGTISREEFYDKVRSIADKDISNSDIDSAWLSFLTGVDSYKFELLIELRKSYRLILLSNNNPIIMEWARRNDFSPQGKTIDDFFDDSYISYEIGYAKPDSSIYDFVIKDSGIVPEESLFLDDGLANITEAEKFGIQTHLVKPYEDLRAIFNL